MKKHIAAHADRPAWLTLPAPDEQALARMKSLLDQGRLHSVCESADCPNIGECFASRICTFMILGSHCTRNCGFCAVQHGRPDAVDPEEPHLLAATAKELGLRHVVITSVTRDDLADGGAGQFAAAVRAVKAELPQAGTEVLIPDFQGSKAALSIVLAAKPDILNHNVETVPRLYSHVRPQAIYSRSLAVLSRTRRAAPDMVVKSGLMLGLGEEIKEVIAVMRDLCNAGCQMLTLGQYLRPSPAHIPVARYVQPEVFSLLAESARQMGFRQVSAGPMVRSSYHADYSFAALQQV